MSLSRLVMNRVAIWSNVRRRSFTRSAAAVTASGTDDKPAAAVGDSSRIFNRPPTGNEMARSAGIMTMGRLPYQQTSQGLDACFVGVPFDIGTSNRSGTRLGPRAIRSESSMVRILSNATGASPFESLQVADVGDINVNPYNLHKSCDLIRDGIRDIITNGCKPLILGGDHTITYPILQAIKNKYGPVALVHVDAHNDTQSEMMGERIGHGTPFFRAVAEKLIDPKKVYQIGIRSSGNVFDDDAWGREQGFKVIPAHDLWHKSCTPLMEEVRAHIGPDTPTYISFDIDSLDPAYAPGTGTPEIGGLTTIQALEIIRGCRGLNIVGCDLVEVAPQYDPTLITAMTAVSLLVEMLHVLPGVKYYNAKRSW